MRANDEIRPTEVAKEEGVWTGKIATVYGVDALCDNRL
jgi:hypothetical protein